MELLYKDEVFAIVGAAIEVHRELGSGFYEAVYQEALAIEFTLRGLPFEGQKVLPIHYKNRLLKKEYVADFCCYDAIIIEIKAADRLSSHDESQVLNYLKATGFRLALLMNFGESNGLSWKRFIR